MRFFDPLRDRTAVREVLGDDAFATLRGDAAVPDALGVNDHPRAAAADAQAGGFGAEGGDVEGFQSGFEEFPGGEAVVGGTAVGADAEEDVALRGLDFHFGETGGDDGVGHGRKREK